MQLFYKKFEMTLADKLWGYASILMASFSTIIFFGGMLANMVEGRSAIGPSPLALVMFTFAVTGLLFGAGGQLILKGSAVGYVALILAFIHLCVAWWGRANGFASYNFAILAICLGCCAWCVVRLVSILK
ncbi:MAG: hypothetical protein ABL949_11605 [Fimbriimonadaceae bacterium]